MLATTSAAAAAAAPATSARTQSLSTSTRSAFTAAGCSSTGSRLLGTAGTVHPDGSDLQEKTRPLNALHGGGSNVLLARGRTRRLQQLHSQLAAAGPRGSAATPSPAVISPSLCGEAAGAMDISFAGKLCLVTGCGHGLGRRIALLLTELGGVVWGCDIRFDDFGAPDDGKVL